MFANVMTYIDRTAMSLMVVLAATPILGIAAQAAFLRRQVEAIGPQAILAVGKFAAQTLSGKELPIGRLRGQIHTYLGIPVIATFHPAFLLRTPQEVRGAWQDLQLLRRVLDGQV